MERVLVAGCGYVGSALGHLLTADGLTVFALRRESGDLPADLTPVVADLSDPATLDGLPPGIDAVVYTASPDTRDEAGYRAAYVDGVANLLDALETSGQLPRRFVLTTSTAVYGETDGSWVDETTPPDPPTATAAVLVAGEQALRDREVASTVVRFGGIYGPGRTRLVESVRQGRAGCPDTPSWTNRIHRDDAAGALRHMLALPQPHDLYLGVDDEPAERCDVLRFLADRLGVDPPPVRPDVGGRPGNKRCRNDRLRASGYRFRFPSYREGYGALIDAAPA